MSYNFYLASFRLFICLSNSSVSDEICNPSFEIVVLLQRSVILARELISPKLNCYFIIQTSVIVSVISARMGWNDWGLG